MARQSQAAPTIFLFCIAYTFLFASFSIAAEATTAPGNKEDIPFLDAESEQTLDDFQARFGSWLGSKASWFDSFFDDDNYLEETNETNAKASVTVGYSKDDDVEFAPRFRLRLKLPHLEERARLIISASDDSGIADDSESPIGSVKDDTERKDVTAGFQYFLRQSVSQHLSVTTGASYNYVYGGLRVRFSRDFGLWHSRFINNLYYYTDDGWENKTSIELDHPLTTNLMFRTILNADWAEDEDGIDNAIRFRFYQFLDIYHSLRYDVGFYFKTSPNYYMDDARFQATHRQRFYRDWLALEISPFFTFPADTGREFNPGILFKFEAEFGYSPEGRGFNLNLINR